MKCQLILLAITVFGSIRAAPQNDLAVAAGQEAMAVGVAERNGADDSTSDHQNDHHYQYYGLDGLSMIYTPPYYVSRAVYDAMASDLAQCQKERDTLMVVQSMELQQEVRAPVEKEDDSKEEEVEVAPMCAMKADSGPCRSYVQRYYYNKDTGRCEKFTYGGCYGNTNNFETEIECESSCINQCSKPLDMGYCSGRLPRYYYNSATGRCQLFYYGGCGGNNNNFMTMQECQTSCDGACVLPKEKGPCLGAIARWYHNSEKNECDVFVYSGCGGNANNFLTKEACEEHC